MRELRILEPRKIEERGIFPAIYIAAVKLDLGSPQHSDQTRIRSLSASPVKDGMRILEKFLAAFKNAGLAPYNSKISGVRVKVSVFLDLRLDRIEFH